MRDFKNGARVVHDVNGAGVVEGYVVLSSGVHYDVRFLCGVSVCCLGGSLSAAPVPAPVLGGSMIERSVNPINGDSRYEIKREFCGYEDARFVARFRGEWVGQSLFYSSAVLLCVGHNCGRKGAPIIEAVEA